MFAIIHPGQGVQHAGMLDGFMSSAIFNQTIEEASDILGKDIRKLVNESTKETLSLTENSQICITAMNVAVDRVWCAAGGPVSYRAGHSLGEYSAYCSGGAFSFSDTMHAVQNRAKMMSSAVIPWEGGMLAVYRTNEDYLNSLLPHDVVIACYNSPDRLVVSGPRTSLSSLKDRLAELGVDSSFLDISLPCHSSYMRPCAEQMREYLSNINLALPVIPVVSSVSGRICETTDSIMTNLQTQIYLPVRWIDTIEYLISQRIHRFIVLGGEKGNYHKMIRDICPEFKIHTIFNEQYLEKTLKDLML